MNDRATNYDPDATEDDGSCIIQGCTDPSASNYNQQAKNVPKSEMSSYAQVTNNISPNLLSSPCNGNEPFPSMCSSLYTTY